MEQLDATPAQEVQAGEVSNEQKVEETENNSAKQRIDFSSKFAALARKEKALFDQKKAIEQEMKEVQEWKQAREIAKRNPNKFLQAHGLDFETIAKFNLEGGEEKAPSEIETLKEKLERLENESRSEKEEREKKEKEALEQNYQKQIVDFKNQIDQNITNNAEKYEFLNADKKHIDDVFELIELHYQQSQKILDIEEACQLVEEFIENEFKNKYLKVNKLKGLLNVPDPSSGKNTQVVSRQQQDIRNSTRPTTLNNSIKPDAGYTQSVDKLTFEERKRQAAAMLRFK